MIKRKYRCPSCFQRKILNERVNLKFENVARIDEICQKLILFPSPRWLHPHANHHIPTHPYIKSKVNFSGGISPHVQPARVLITPRREQYIIPRHLLTLRGPIEK